MAFIPDYATVIASFLLAFKAILVEGSEVAILSLATVKQLGKRNVLLGVVLGGLGSVVTFVIVRQVFVLLSGVADYLVNLITGVVILYFSYRFLRGFVKYHYRGKSFRVKMEGMAHDVVEKDLQHMHGQTLPTGEIPFSLANSSPVLTITLTEGFEASLVVAAAGAFNFQWTLIGAIASLALLIVVSAVSYDYLIRLPRWALDLLAGSVLLTFGLFFLITGILLALGVIS
jgi:uncharacterized membrane protein